MGGARGRCSPSPRRRLRRRRPLRLSGSDKIPSSAQSGGRREPHRAKPRDGDRIGVVAARRHLHHLGLRTREAGCSVPSAGRRTTLLGAGLTGTSPMPNEPLECRKRVVWSNAAKPARKPGSQCAWLRTLEHGVTAAYLEWTTRRNRGVREERLSWSTAPRGRILHPASPGSEPRSVRPSRGGQSFGR